MITKLYRVTIAIDDKDGYAADVDAHNVLAETAKQAMEKTALDENEFVDEVIIIGVVDKE